LSKCITITIHVVPRQTNTTHPVFSHLTAHAFILCNRPFSLSALSILFSLVPGDVGAWVYPLARRMFSYSCTVWVSLPYPPPRSLQFSDLIAIFLLSPLEHSPHTCDPHHPFPSISTPSSTYHSPSASSTRSSYYPPFPPTSSRLVTHLLFHNQSTQHLCIFLAILFFQFYCTTVLFTPAPPSPPLSAHRCGDQISLSLSHINRPCSSCHTIFMLSVGNSGMSQVSILHRIRWSFTARLSVLPLVLRLLEP